MCAIKKLRLKPALNFFVILATIIIATLTMGVTVSAQSVDLSDHDCVALAHVLFSGDGLSGSGTKADADSDSFGQLLARKEYALPVEGETTRQLPFILVYVVYDEETSSKVGTLVTYYSDIISYLCHPTDVNGKHEYELLFNYRVYSNLSKSGQKTLIKNLVKDIRASDMTPSGRQKIYNMLYDFDDSIINSYIPDLLSNTAKANLSGALMYIEDLGVPSFVKLILGVLCIVIFMMTIFTTLLDLLYLTVPFFTDFINSKETSSTNTNRHRYSDNNISTIGTHLVSKHAINAYTKSCEDTDKLALLIWLPKHALIILVMFLMIHLLSSGLLSGMLVWFNDIFTMD